MSGISGILEAVYPAEQLGNLILTGVYPRIFTPNGDGANDQAVFHFDNSDQLPVRGEIFDLPGIVSRKKQLIPYLTSLLKEMQTDGTLPRNTREPFGKTRKS